MSNSFSLTAEPSSSIGGKATTNALIGYTQRSKTYSAMKLDRVPVGAVASGGPNANESECTDNFTAPALQAFESVSRKPRSETASSSPQLEDIQSCPKSDSFQATPHMLAHGNMTQRKAPVRLPLQRPGPPDMKQDFQTQANSSSLSVSVAEGLIMSAGSIPQIEQCVNSVVEETKRVVAKLPVPSSASPSTPFVTAAVPQPLSPCPATGTATMLPQPNVVLPSLHICDRLPPSERGCSAVYDEKVLHADSKPGFSEHPDMLKAEQLSSSAVLQSSLSDISASGVSGPLSSPSKLACQPYNKELPIHALPSSTLTFVGQRESHCSNSPKPSKKRRVGSTSAGSTQLTGGDEVSPKSETVETSAAPGALPPRPSGQTSTTLGSAGACQASGKLVNALIASVPVVSEHPPLPSFNSQGKVVLPSSLLPDLIASGEVIDPLGVRVAEGKNGEFSRRSSQMGPAYSIVTQLCHRASRRALSLANASQRLMSSLLQFRMEDDGHVGEYGGSSSSGTTSINDNCGGNVDGDVVPSHAVVEPLTLTAGCETVQPSLREGKLCSVEARNWEKTAELIERCLDETKSSGRYCSNLCRAATALRMARLCEVSDREARLLTLQQHCFRLLRNLNTCCPQWGYHEGSYLWHTGRVLDTSALRDISAYALVFEDLVQDIALRLQEAQTKLSSFQTAQKVSASNSISGLQGGDAVVQSLTGQQTTAPAAASSGSGSSQKTKYGSSSSGKGNWGNATHPSPHQIPSSVSGPVSPTRRTTSPAVACDRTEKELKDSSELEYSRGNNAHCEPAAVATNPAVCSGEMASALLTSLMFQVDSTTIAQCLILLDDLRRRHDVGFQPLASLQEVMASFVATQALHGIYQPPTHFLGGTATRFRSTADISASAGRGSKRRAAAAAMLANQTAAAQLVIPGGISNVSGATANVSNVISLVNGMGSSSGTSGAKTRAKRQPGPQQQTSSQQPHPFPPHQQQPAMQQQQSAPQQPQPAPQQAQPTPQQPQPTSQQPQPARHHSQPVPQQPQPVPSQPHSVSEQQHPTVQQHQQPPSVIPSTPQGGVSSGIQESSVRIFPQGSSDASALPFSMGGQSKAALLGVDKSPVDPFTVRHSAEAYTVQHSLHNLGASGGGDKRCTAGGEDEDDERARVITGEGGASTVRSAEYKGVTLPSLRAQGTGTWEMENVEDSESKLSPSDALAPQEHENDRLPQQQRDLTTTPDEEWEESDGGSSSANEGPGSAVSYGHHSYHPPSSFSGNAITTSSPVGTLTSAGSSPRGSVVLPNTGLPDGFELPRDPQEFRSDVKGVYYDDTSNRWCASWHERKTGKKKSRYFAVKKFGFSIAKTHAMDARLEAEETGECAPTNIN